MLRQEKGAKYFCPAEYTTKAKPKNLTLNLVSFFGFLGLGLGLVLGSPLVLSFQALLPSTDSTVYVHDMVLLRCLTI